VFLVDDFQLDKALEHTYSVLDLNPLKIKFTDDKPKDDKKQAVKLDKYADEPDEKSVMQEYIVLDAESCQSLKDYLFRLTSENLFQRSSV